MLNLMGFMVAAVVSTAAPTTRAATIELPKLLRPVIDPTDYPEASVLAGEQGVVRYRYEVGVEGRVEKCVVTQSSGFRMLDRTTCRLLEKRARFKPATRDGVPVRALVDDVMIWTLPGTRPARPRSD